MTPDRITRLCDSEGSLTELMPPYLVCAGFVLLFTALPYEGTPARIFRGRVLRDT